MYSKRENVYIPSISNSPMSYLLTELFSIKIYLNKLGIFVIFMAFIVKKYKWDRKLKGLVRYTHINTVSET